MQQSVNNQDMIVYRKPTAVVDIAKRMQEAFARNLHLLDEFVKKFALAFSKRVKIPVYWGNPFSPRD